jgi:inhibitor of cysteine peptidase
MWWNWILSLFALGVVIMPLSSSGETQMVRLSEKDTGSTITLARGAIMEITLAANPATGYSWQPTTIDPSVLKYLGSDFAGEHATLGGGGRAFLRFQALASGQSELELGYYRYPFEPVSEAAERFRVTVIVTP